MGKGGAHSAMARKARMVRRATGMARNELRQERQAGTRFSCSTGATSPPVKGLSPELAAAIADFQRQRRP